MKHPLILHCWPMLEAKKGLCCNCLWWGFFLGMPIPSIGCRVGAISCTAGLPLQPITSQLVCPCWPCGVPASHFWPCRVAPAYPCNTSLAWNAGKIWVAIAQLMSMLKLQIEKNLSKSKNPWLLFAPNVRSCPSTSIPMIINSSNYPPNFYLLFTLITQKWG